MVYGCKLVELNPEKYSWQFVKEAATNVGFSDCGIARADRLSEEEYPLDEWLAEGYNADMEYMGRNAEMRRDPRLLVDGARSVISLVLAYKPDRMMEGVLKIAQYAYGEDYHERLKRMMYQLIAAIKVRYPDFEGRPFVDTAPISDRHWAVRAGLGWIGKNTLFIHPRYGSFCFLGEIVTSAPFDHYSNNRNSKLSKLSNNPSTVQGDLQSPCADCSLCVDACPNHAIITKPTQPTTFNSQLSTLNLIDSRRCTSYNTIENRNDNLPADLNTRGYIFGCDICQLVCPYNKDVSPAFSLSDERKQQLEALASADEECFNKFRKHSPLSRIKHNQLLRNIDKAKRRLLLIQ